LSNALEVEVKFHLSDPDRMRDALVAAGAMSSGRVFEKNIRLDDASGTLKRQGMLLRLRSDDGVRLTFKSKPPHQDSQFKVHQELETDVGDFKTCQNILEALGFFPEQVYEKWRETFLLGDTKCLIDTMPFGVFLEIEGKGTRIREIANQFDLGWEERILLNYLEIFEIIQRREGLGFTDITFEHFESIEVDLGKHLHLLYAQSNPPQ
jgi:adenylate cyclase class 2